MCRFPNVIDRDLFLPLFCFVVKHGVLRDLFLLNARFGKRRTVVAAEMRATSFL